jgi:hypothetical protein
VIWVEDLNINNRVNDQKLEFSALTQMIGPYFASIAQASTKYMCSMKIMKMISEARRDSCIIDRMYVFIVQFEKYKLVLEVG